MTEALLKIPFSPYETCMQFHRVVRVATIGQEWRPYESPPWCENYLSKLKFQKIYGEIRGKTTIYPSFYRG